MDDDNRKFLWEKNCPLTYRDATVVLFKKPLTRVEQPPATDPQTILNDGDRPTLGSFVFG